MIKTGLELKMKLLKMLLKLILSITYFDKGNGFLKSHPRATKAIPTANPQMTKRPSTSPKCSLQFGRSKRAFFTASSRACLTAEPSHLLILTGWKFKCKLRTCLCMLNFLGSWWKLDVLKK